jgi:flavocytochrome c
VDAVISEDDLLPDSFWKDTCSSIGARDPAIINLSLNPERNTGYNGTHIWNAIYEENCGDTCLEERVLYKLMSALHTSTTLSIARHYYAPSRKKNRTSYEPNPSYFVEKFRDHPEYISNLHFGYAVLLRALRKATDFLYDVPIKTDNPADDERALKLLRRLLDTSFISSCSPVFDAFDETAMFKGQEVELRSSFKGVFQNVSSILDCVQCQQCKLHGKLAMTGYGAALKVLFMDTVSLDDNEVVGLVNTLVKFSESLRHVRELSKLYLEQEISSSATLQAASGSGYTAPSTTPAARQLTPSAPPSSMESYVDLAVGAVAALGRAKTISWENEQELIRLALAKDDTLLVLSAHYASDPDKLFHLLSGNGLIKSLGPDAIVIGSGLAGLAATVNLLDRGGRVVLIEKEHLIGGNSNKASSGINACCFNYTADELAVFYKDTLKSAGASARPILIETLVNKSAEAVNWLRDRVGVDLSLTAQLGGHSSKRTHRPSNGMAGAEIIYGLQKLVKNFAKSNPDQMTILLDSKVSQLLTEGDKVVGVEYTDKSGNLVKLFAPNVVLATGGFASDRSPGSYLDLHRPELIHMATTAGPFSTGDGITLARSLGAGLTDMDKVQIHPTGWVDPSDPNATSKILAAELLRGVGGLVINQEGKRFCNELGTRAYVTDAMLRHDRSYAETGKWDAGSTVPIFSLVLSSAAAADAKKHVDLYTHKGLLTKVEGVSKLAEWLGLSKKTVVATMLSYQEAAKKAVDSFGKTEFRNLPAEDLSKETFYVGKITPVLHYCMGGITIDTDGSVVREDGRIIEGLHAAGEVSGGVHGENRLGGNSLLECTVYGTIVGKKLPVRGSSAIRSSAHASAAENSIAKKSNDRVVSMSELSEHNTEKDCWVLIHGKVYDLTEFAAEHPAGPDSILDLAGKDGTEAFAAVHNQAMLNEFDDEIIGIFKG